MLAHAFRNVPFNTLMSQVPKPAERARFLSLQSTVQHTAAAAGSFLSSHLLREQPDGRLSGMPQVALVAMGLTALLPLELFLLERLVAVRWHRKRGPLLQVLYRPTRGDTSDLRCAAGFVGPAVRRCSL